jgi:murein DD-endopeptidase MepM/ murein hydrolase activator NlpD
LNKKKRFLVIPSKNKRIRYIRIRFSIIIIFIIILLGGVAGFFIPFSAFTLNVVELNQKKHLTEQNRKLLSKIRSMQEIFRALKSRVDTLDRMKSNIEDLIDIKELVEVIDTSFENELKNVSLDETLDYLKSVEAFYSNFINKIEKTNAYITEIPVIKPVIDEHVITARFSKMKDPFTGDLKDHKGIDFSAKRGTPVIATASGVVDLVENHKYWGNRIRIKHRYGFSSVYAHLGTVNVRMDQKVKKGDEIGTIGLSGLTIGPHLHYEIRRHGTLIDPENYFFPEDISQLTAE